jgi:site-specific recombinase XerD
MPDTMTGSKESLNLGTNLVPAYLSPADWTGGLLSNCFNNIDLISEHFYNYGGTHFSLAEGRQVPNDPNEPITDWMRRPANHIRIKYEEYKEYEKLLPQLAARPKPLNIDEWAYSSRGGSGSYPVYPSYAWVFHEMFRLIQRVLAIPRKRHSRPLIGFLARPEIEALLSVVDRHTWIGQRDYALLLVAIQTGLRLSELTGLRQQDVCVAAGPHIRCVGKGRKERCTPLTKATAAVLAYWMELQNADESQHLFPSTRGGRLSADAVQRLVQKYVGDAHKLCPSLAKKRVTPHVLRHTAAMEMLQAGVDRALIAIWLGHEKVDTTQIYLDANLPLKEEILAKTSPVKGKQSRFRASDRLLNFLKNL